MDLLFSTKASNELTRYPVGNTVNKQYKILSPLIPILGGNIYKIEDITSLENKQYLLIQMESNVDCQNYQEERPALKLLSYEKQNESSGKEFVLETTGYRFLGELLQESKKEEDYKTIFLIVMEWLEKFHQQHRKSFPFLHYHNVLLSEKNIIVFGSSFVYNYFKCQNNPYAHLVSPNYVNSLRFPQGSKYNPWSDYYPISIMLWEQFLKHPPSWDDHSMRFQEEISAGMYNEFIQSFTESNAPYLNMDNPLERFKNLKLSPVVMPSPAPPVAYMPYSIDSPGAAYEERPSGKAIDSSKIKSMEQENSRLYEKLDEVYQQVENLKKESKQKTKLFSLIFTGMIGIVLGAICILYFLGFRLLSPAQLELQEKIKIQKNFWHTIGLLQSHRIEEAKKLCEEITETKEHPLLYAYLHVLQNIYEMTKEQNSENQNILRKNMIEKLLFLDANKEQLSSEIERFEISISINEISHWLKIYKK